MKINTLTTVSLITGVLIGTSFSPIQALQRESEKEELAHFFEHIMFKGSVKDQFNGKSNLPSDEKIKERSSVELDFNAGEIRSRDASKIRNYLEVIARVEVKDSKKDSRRASQLLDESVATAPRLEKNHIVLGTGSVVTGKEEWEKSVRIRLPYNMSVLEVGRSLVNLGAVYDGTDYIISPEQFLKHYSNLINLPGIEEADFKITGMEKEDFLKIVPSKISEDLKKQDFVILWDVGGGYFARGGWGEAFYTKLGDKLYGYDSLLGKFTFRGPLARDISAALPPAARVDIKVKKTSASVVPSIFEAHGIPLGLDSQGYWSSKDVKVADIPFEEWMDDIEITLSKEVMDFQKKRLLKEKLLNRLLKGEDSK
ncbi:MAG: hypothetical protein JSS34_00965 [Proteobacteria bacterium]|nr:hypothetical protein [Pseudomonadota bacterium]